MTHHTKRYAQQIDQIMSLLINFWSTWNTHPTKILDAACLRPFYLKKYRFTDIVHTDYSMCQEMIQKLP